MKPAGAGNQIYICGFEEVTDADMPGSVQPMVDLSDPNARANLQPHDMVYGIPLVIGAKKGFPNFNEFAMQTQVQVTRKLQFHRPGLHDLGRESKSTRCSWWAFPMCSASKPGIPTAPLSRATCKWSCGPDMNVLA